MPIKKPERITTNGAEAVVNALPQQQQRLSHIITKTPALGTEERGFPYIGLQSSSASYSRCGSSSENTKFPVMTVNLWLCLQTPLESTTMRHTGHQTVAPGVNLDAVASTHQTWACSQRAQLCCCVPRLSWDVHHSTFPAGRILDLCVFTAS